MYFTEILLVGILHRAPPHPKAFVMLDQGDQERYKCCAQFLNAGMEFPPVCIGRCTKTYFGTIEVIVLPTELSG